MRSVVIAGCADLGTETGLRLGRARCGPGAPTIGTLDARRPREARPPGRSRSSPPKEKLFSTVVRRDALALDETEDAVEKSTARAQRFVELALHPLDMPAFFGADLAGLRRRAHLEIPAVAKAVLESVMSYLLLPCCRAGVRRADEPQESLR